MWCSGMGETITLIWFGHMERKKGEECEENVCE